MPSCGFCRSSVSKRENQRKQRKKKKKKGDQYLNLARERRKAVEYLGDGDTNCSWRTWNGPQRKAGDHANYNIVEIGQNTKKSPGDLSRLVTQTPVKDHQLTNKGGNNYYND